jgi:hypothetical protein
MSGFSGYSGFSGSGESGYSGFSGSGISGYSGYSGSGLSGYSGFSGDANSGYSGYSGASTSGYSGFSGDGTSGYSGYSGSGTSGYSGYSGDSGLSGYSGYSGTGTSGYSGYSGDSGISGYSGYSGSGLSGYSGFSGSGISGYSGFSGSGVSGYSGYSGIGTSGFSGYSGFSGLSGYSGYSGSGVSGYSGFSGSGISGYSGFSGVAGTPSLTSTQIAFGDVSNLMTSSANLTWDSTNNILTTSRPSIGTSSALNGLIVQSATLSTSIATAQYSPNFVLRGHGWNSSTLVDNTYDWSFQNQVTGNLSNLTGVLKIDAVNNAGSHVNFISIAGVATTITFNQPTIVNSFLVAPTIQGNVSSAATAITFNNSSEIFAANGHMQIDRNGALQTDRNYMLYVGGEALIFGGTVISQVTAPTLTASYSGAAGSATYKYKVVAILVNGTTTDASPEVTGTSAGVSTLGGNVMLITVVPVRGAYQYKVYRTVAGGTGSSGTTGIIATVNQTATSNSTALFDNGGAGDGTTPPSTNTTGNIGLLITTPTSNLDVRGSVAFNYTTTAVDYTALFTDNLIEVTATGKTITLPTAVGCQGREYIIKLTASGSGTVATTSSQNIDASTTYSLSAQYKYVSVKSNNANWLIVANN